ncbi:unnamed protein product [Sphenostylis stenocarpa]|uniref:Uncharacterized protein n=1 Tax=Sphenostylis stenocarpa TaxID=92480 RepID=A0AA86VBT3_9FABA|nr:unnamed protein product [Sphenostylis stenocarpa]
MKGVGVGSRKRVEAKVLLDVGLGRGQRHAPCRVSYGHVFVRVRKLILLSPSLPPCEKSLLICNKIHSTFTKKMITKKMKMKMKTKMVRRKKMKVVKQWKHECIWLRVLNE